MIHHNVAKKALRAYIVVLCLFGTAGAEEFYGVTAAGFVYSGELTPENSGVLWTPVADVGDIFTNNWRDISIAGDPYDESLLHIVVPGTGFSELYEYDIIEKKISKVRAYSFEVTGLHATCEGELLATLDGDNEKALDLFNSSKSLPFTNANHRNSVRDATSLNDQIWISHGTEIQQPFNDSANLTSDNECSISGIAGIDKKNIIVGSTVCDDEIVIFDMAENKSIVVSLEARVDQLRDLAKPPGFCLDAVDGQTGQTGQTEPEENQQQTGSLTSGCSSKSSNSILTILFLPLILGMRRNKRKASYLAVATLLAAIPATAENKKAEALSIEGISSAERGDFHGAIRLFKRASATENLPKYDCNIGLAYSQLKSWARAMTFLERCAREWEGDTEIPSWVPSEIEKIRSRLDENNHQLVHINFQAKRVSLSWFAPDETFRTPLTVWAPMGEHVVRWERGNTTAKQKIVIENDAVQVNLPTDFYEAESKPIETKFIFTQPKQSGWSSNGTTWALTVSGLMLGSSIASYAVTRSYAAEAATTTSQSQYDALDRRIVIGNAVTATTVTIGAVSLGVAMWLHRKNHKSERLPVASIGKRHATLGMRWSY